MYRLNKYQSWLVKGRGEGIALQPNESKGWEYGYRRRMLGIFRVCRDEVFEWKRLAKNEEKRRKHEMSGFGKRASYKGYR